MHRLASSHSMLVALRRAHEPPASPQAREPSTGVASVAARPGAHGGDTRARARRPHTDDRGAGSILILIIVMFVAIAAYVALCGASWMRCAHTARNAADLAALAGAQQLAAGRDPCGASEWTARANGATMTGCQADIANGRLVVQVNVTVVADPRLPGGPAEFAATAKAGRL